MFMDMLQTILQYGPFSTALACFKTGWPGFKATVIAQPVLNLTHFAYLSVTMYSDQTRGEAAARPSARVSQTTISMQRWA